MFLQCCITMLVGIKHSQHDITMSDIKKRIPTNTNTPKINGRNVVDR